MIASECLLRQLNIPVRVSSKSRRRFLTLIRCVIFHVIFVLKCVFLGACTFCRRATLQKRCGPTGMRNSFLLKFLTAFQSSRKNDILRRAPTLERKQEHGPCIDKPYCRPKFTMTLVAVKEMIRLTVQSHRISLHHLCSRNYFCIFCIVDCNKNSDQIILRMFVGFCIVPSGQVTKLLRKNYIK